MGWLGSGGMQAGEEEEAAGAGTGLFLLAHGVLGV